MIKPANRDEIARTIGKEWSPIRIDNDYFHASVNDRKSPERAAYEQRFRVEDKPSVDWYVCTSLAGTIVFWFCVIWFLAWRFGG